MSLLLAADRVEVDLRGWGCTTYATVDPVRTADEGTTDGGYVSVPLGVGAPQIELGGEFPPGGLADMQWSVLKRWAANQETIRASEYTPTGTRVYLGTYHLTGQMRREGVELLNGVPVKIRWRLRFQREGD